MPLNWFPQTWKDRSALAALMVQLCPLGPPDSLFSLASSKCPLEDEVGSEGAQSGRWPRGYFREESRRGDKQLKNSGIGSRPVLSAPLPPSRDLEEGRSGLEGPVVKTLCFHCRGAQVSSLVWKLRFHMPCGLAKKQNKLL